MVAAASPAPSSLCQKDRCQKERCSLGEAREPRHCVHRARAGALRLGGAFQMKQQTNGTENRTYLETVSHLKQFLCKPLDNRATEHSGCRLCPQNWFLHGNKCYWISEENRTWHESEKDCRAKLSDMLVIEDQDEVAFIQSIVEGAHLLWIGLTATLPERKWTWVNGTPLDDKISQGIGPVEADSCGQLNENRIVPEACSAVARWICKTDSLLI
ncbi:PREDICTED: killer cell lectin-like receptor subfamily B member 1C [Gekko japonicus]|uniref:Killer cell lectin-like receptor subfamily B member 1C n=1 Tax=Gekko japonicus TaxID=146911 RepID=A0ABM1K4A7_GEKJA|nr:PREDICTED: killer cell lectin-like receptor subfamily B member 1C [Gekko japonicus]